MGVLNKYGQGGLTIKQKAFVHNLTKGHNQTESAILAGYSTKNADVIASGLVRNHKIIKALDKVGLTDESIAQGLKTNFEEGIGVKVTADTSVKIAELIFKIRGYTDNKPDNMTQNNVYINELNSMSDEELKTRLEALQQATASNNT